MIKKSKHLSSGPTMRQNTEEELIKSTPQVDDEQSAFGSMPNPEQVKSNDTLDQAHKMGLYTKADEEHPAPINIAKQVNNAEKYYGTH